MSSKLDKQICLFQLGEAYEIVNSIYKIIVQMVTITIGAQAAIISIWFEGRNPLLLLVGGFVSLALVYQLHRTSRPLTAAAITALSLEKELGLVNEKSLTGTFVTSFRGMKFLDELRKIATLDEEIFKANWSKNISRYTLYSIKNSGTSKMFLILGITQIAIAGYILIFL